MLVLKRQMESREGGREGEEMENLQSREGKFIDSKNNHSVDVSF